MIVLFQVAITTYKNFWNSGGIFGVHNNMAANDLIQALLMFHPVLVYRSIAYTEDQSQ